MLQAARQNAPVNLDAKDTAHMNELRVLLDGNPPQRITYQ